MFSWSFSRLATSLLHFQRVHGAEHEGPVPRQHDGGAAAPARRQLGRAVNQFTHDQALRRVPVLHQRDPVEATRPSSEKK